MIWAITRIASDFKTWDRATRIAVISGFALLAALLIVAFAVPDLRQPALLGAGGLLIVSELAVMWGNRGMIAPLTLAQRHYVAGDFDAALRVLEGMRAKGKIDMRAATLLGNTYRQLSRLAESEAILSEAIHKAPDHYFPRYGFGRTLLAKGDYAGALDSIRRAIEQGAPAVVHLDLAEVYFRLGMFAEARAELESHQSSEPYRQLMRAYLLHTIDGNLPPPSPELMESGLPYWVASAERYRETPYGVALIRDIDDMQGAASK
ncbi:MAG: tetratricopeptide repeat protein [Anaerolinea sp.]|nr:tetratricopeptide repeat protein [Anaerolinea sp.]